MLFEFPICDVEIQNILAQTIAKESPCLDLNQSF